MRASGALLAAAMLLLAGCGGRSGRYGPPPTSAETTFIRQCGACHTLAAAGTKGTVGADLDELRPSSPRVLRAIREGTGVMAADLVTGDEAKLVANYVARSAGR